MVPGQQRSLNAVRRPLTAFVVVAALTWWIARGSDVFYVIGLDGPASALAGPLLPALAAGATGALVLSLLEAGAGRLAGLTGVVVVLLLPAFVDIHRESVRGPPLLALMLFMVAVMVHAPRFSFAYGGLAAVMAVFVSPAAIGLPVAAASWSLLQAQRRGRRRWRRVALGLAPLMVALALVPWVGTDAWPAGVSLGWRGHLDGVLGAVGRVLGDHLAPGVGPGGFRWLIVADVTLIVLALFAVTWRRTIDPMPPTRTARQLFEALAITAACHAGGMIAGSLLIRGAPDPDVAGIFPLVAVLAVMVVLAMALSWSGWSRAGKLVSLALVLGWAGASIILR